MNQITAILSDYYIGGLVSAEEALKSIHDLLKKNSRRGLKLRKIRRVDYINELLNQIDSLEYMVYSYKDLGLNTKNRVMYLVRKGKDLFVKNKNRNAWGPVVEKSLEITSEESKQEILNVLEKEMKNKKDELENMVTSGFQEDWVKIND